MVLGSVKPVPCGRNAQSMISPLRFPTELHREVAELAGDFFSAHTHVDTILVVNSCARGCAVAGSDLDLAVLITAAAVSQEVQSLTTHLDVDRFVVVCSGNVGGSCPHWLHRLRNRCACDAQWQAVEYGGRATEDDYGSGLRN